MTRSTLFPSRDTDPLAAGLLGLGTGLAMMLRPRPASAGQRRAWLRALLARLRGQNRLSGADARTLRDLGVGATKARPHWHASADAATALELRANGWR